MIEIHVVFPSIQLLQEYICTCIRPKDYSIESVNLPPPPISSPNSINHDAFERQHHFIFFQSIIYFEILMNW